MDEFCGHSYTALYPKYVKIVQVTISGEKKKGDTLFQNECMKEKRLCLARLHWSEVSHNLAACTADECYIDHRSYSSIVVNP